MKKSAKQQLIDLQRGESVEFEKERFYYISKIAYIINTERGGGSLKITYKKKLPKLTVTRIK